MLKLRKALILAILLVGAGFGLYVVFSAWPGGNREANSDAKGKPPAPQLHAWLTLSPKPPTPQSGFTDEAGKPARLVDFAGKPVLLNVWATWCEPCIRELPSLDRLADQLGVDGPVQVLAINEDRNQADARTWMDANSITHLPLYQDGKLNLVRDLYVKDYPSGLPITVLYDANGREVARWYGEAQWDSPAMQAQFLSLLK